MTQEVSRHLVAGTPDHVFVQIGPTLIEGPVGVTDNPRPVELKSRLLADDPFRIVLAKRKLAPEPCRVVVARCKSNETRFESRAGPCNDKRIAHCDDASHLHRTEICHGDTV